MQHKKLCGSCKYSCRQSTVFILLFYGIFQHVNDRQEYLRLYITARVCSKSFWIYICEFMIWNDTIDQCDPEYRLKFDLSKKHWSLLKKLEFCKIFHDQNGWKLIYSSLKSTTNNFKFESLKIIICWTPSFLYDFRISLIGNWFYGMFEWKM